MLILNNDKNVHDISLQLSTPSIDPTHDGEGTNPTHDEGLDVHHNDTSIYSIYIEN